jgi:hypothetical protein|tara:strand:- start:1349 stop:1591 length:243 start_codon:yes stop_codon:yes gene_type:complete
MTDLVTLSNAVNTLQTGVSTLSTDATTLFTAVTSLKTTVATQISDAVTTSENQALEPMMSMAANFTLLAAMIVSNMTPEA